MTITLNPVNDSVEIYDGPDTDPAPTLIYSGKQLISVDSNGEVVGMQDAPPVDADIHEIIRYISNRKMPAEARLAGLESEKAALLKMVCDHYDPQINQQKSILKWLTGQYSQVLESFTRTALIGQKARSIKVGLLKLGLRKAGGGIEVVDEKTAIQWAKLACPEAVKESFLKSRVPGDVELTEATGMKRVEVRDDWYVE